MANSSGVVGYGGGRSYRGLGLSSRRAKYKSGPKLRLGSGTSIPAWLAQQNQDVQGARDAEALAQAAEGGTDAFITFAQERITANADPTMQAQWKSLLAKAQSAKGENEQSMAMDSYAHDVLSGEKAASEYVDYLNAARAKAKFGTPAYLDIVAHMDEAKHWLDLMNRAQETRHDQALQSGVESGEIPLESALAYLQNRRAQFDSGDNNFGRITRQIADVQSGIKARNFNGEINMAHASFIETGDKQVYLDHLTGLLPRTSDPTMQKQIYDSAVALKKQIATDAQTKQAQQDYSKIIGYYQTPNGATTNATATLQYLQEQAINAKTPAEASKYATLASQVMSHQQSLVRAAGAAGPNVTSVNNALLPIKAAYDAALQDIRDTTISGNTPTKAQWANYENATRNYRAAVVGTSQINNLAVQNAADTKLKNIDANQDTSIRNVAMTIANEAVEVRDFSFQRAVENAKDDPEALARAVGARMGGLYAALSDPFIRATVDENGNSSAVDRIRKAMDAAQSPVAKGISDNSAVIAGKKSGGAMSKIDNGYDLYLAEYRASHSNKPDPLRDAASLATWRRTFIGGYDENGDWRPPLSMSEFQSKLGQDLPAVDVDGTALTWNAARGAWYGSNDKPTVPTYQSKMPHDILGISKLFELGEQHKEDSDTALRNLVTLTQARNTLGNIDQSWQAGGERDESTRALRDSHKYLGGASFTPVGSGRMSNSSRWQNRDIDFGDRDSAGRLLGTLPAEEPDNVVEAALDDGSDNDPLIAALAAISGEQDMSGAIPSYSVPSVGAGDPLIAAAPSGTSAPPIEAPPAFA